MIFTPQEREDWSTKKYSESSFRFMQRSPWPMAGLMRDCINKWGLSFENDKEFISKFKSKNDKQHDAALFEMFLYTYLRNAGLSIRRKSRGSLKTPDFDLRGKEDDTIYLECSLSANALESGEEKRKIDSVLQYISEIPNFPFVVIVRFETLSDKSISKRRLLNFLNKFQDSEDELIYEEDGWQLVFKLAAKNTLTNRTLGAFSRPAKTIDNFTPLYNALLDKRPKKYKIDGAGYIVCLAIDDLSVGDIELCTVLFGPQNMDAIQVDRSGSGLFLNNGIPVNTSISGVMFCNGLHPFRLGSTQISLWHNPFAAMPIDEKLLPCRNISYHGNGNILTPEVIYNEKSPFELLQVPEEEYFEYLQMKYRQAPK